MNTRFVILLFAVIAFTGCKSNSEIVAEEIANIKNQPPLPVEEAEVNIPPPTFQYSGHNLRSPFLPPSMAMDLRRMGDRRIMPDFNRPKGALEMFALEQLAMKGSLASKEKGRLGLVQDPSGEIHKVMRGHYLGVNFGRIVDISDSEIKLIEIVPNGTDGYVERPRSLVMDLNKTKR